MKRIRSQITYANVMSTIAVFLVLGGATAYAARKIGANQLKANSVGTVKIKANAVTTRKIKKNAVTTVKIKNGAVNNDKLAGGSVSGDKLAASSVSFAKLATGSGVIATASGSIGAVQGTTAAPADIPLSGTTTFTPATGVVDLLSVEARGSLTETGAEKCSAEVRPYINGNPWSDPNGSVTVASAGTPVPAGEPNGQPLGGTTGPVGLTSPGVPVTIGVKLVGDPLNCTPGSTVSVAIAVTQAK